MHDPVTLALKAAIERDDSPELRHALGEHLTRLGKHEEALGEFEAALRLDASHLPSLTGAAASARTLGDRAKATAYDLAAGSATQVPSPSSTSESTAKTAPSSTEPAASVHITTGHLSSAPPEDHAAVFTKTDPPKLRLVATDGERIDDETEPPLTFADIGGMDDIRKRLTRAFLQPLRQPELYKKYGKQIGGGLVLYGPPGCGKTFLARALAGEIGARFLNVGLSDVLSMWLGESERHLHELFENARRAAPAVLFFDEVDALGQRRSHLRGSAGRNLVNQLLSELDGFAGKNEGVFFLGATNHPWDLDPAIRRPGRFDQLIFVPPPDLEARKHILDLKLQRKPVSSGLDIHALSGLCNGFSGADLDLVVNLATDLAIEQSLATGTDVPVTQPLLLRAIKETRPSTRPWLETARNYALYANEGGVYDELLAFLKTAGLT